MPSLRLVMAVALLLAGCLAQAKNQLEGVRMHEAPNHTRVVLDTSGPVKYNLFTLSNPDRIVVDLRNTAPAAGFDPSVVAVGRQRVSSVRGGDREDGYRLVLDVTSKLTPKVFPLAPVEPYGHRLVIDLHTNEKRAPIVRSQPETDRDVLVAVVAGHGGDDPGAIAVNKLREKTVVLQISKRVVRKLNALEGFSAELIRKSDYYIPLRERIELARKARADLFVSIHADAFKSPKVSGASVYVLSERGASSETARWLAAKENRADLIGGVGDVSLDDKDPILRSVLLDLSMDAKRSISFAAGEAVLKELGKVTKLHKKGVEQAGFVVLKSPDVPSILIESGYLSNPGEAKLLGQREHQEKISTAIARGIAGYFRHAPPPATLLAKRLRESGEGGALERYTVLRGDTLSEIAEKFGVATATIRQANGLKNNDNIRIGQVLLIPTS